MGTDVPRKRGLLARLFAKLKHRLRKMFGEPDEPKIYPFF
jgi:hypothetical protein